MLKLLHPDTPRTSIVAPAKASPRAYEGAAARNAWNCFETVKTMVFPCWTTVGAAFLGVREIAIIPCSRLN
jgi:hypothetical protein